MIKSDKIGRNTYCDSCYVLGGSCAAHDSTFSRLCTGDRVNKFVNWSSWPYRLQTLTDTHIASCGFRISPMPPWLLVKHSPIKRLKQSCSKHQTCLANKNKMVLVLQTTLLKVFLEWNYFHFDSNFAHDDQGIGSKAIAGFSSFVTKV